MLQQQCPCSDCAMLVDDVLMCATLARHGLGGKTGRRWKTGGLTRPDLSVVVNSLQQPCGCARDHRRSLPVASHIIQVYVSHEWT